MAEAATVRSDRKRVDVPALESWLWKAACTIRGPLDAPKFKDYILPLVFVKRLSDVFDDEVSHLAREFGDKGTVAKLAKQDRKLVRFYIPEKARWAKIAATTTGLGQFLTDAVCAIARENRRLSGVVDVTDFNATAAGQRIVDDQHLAGLVQVLNNPDYRLGLDDVEPDILGRAYEYLLRKFAEGQGQSAGEFYTPREIAVVMARFLEPQPGMTVYDPCCGSGGLLIKCHLRLLETKGKFENGRVRLPASVAPLKLHGQEINASTFAITRINAFIHEMEAEIALANTMQRPAFTEGDGRLRRFDLVTANPMWNQRFDASTYKNDTYGRFVYGTPPLSSADWGWVQHMTASLKPTGRMAVVLGTGAVSRGIGHHGSNREQAIRKAFVEQDLIEAVVLLPENLFYNTAAPGIVMVVNRRKKHPGEILLINASKLFSKGRPKNYLEDEHISRIARAYQQWKAEESLSAIIPGDQVIKADYNLLPSRYVSTSAEAEAMPLDEAVVLLREAEEERAEADRELRDVLRVLGFEGWRIVEPTTISEGALPAGWKREPLRNILRLSCGKSRPREAIASPDATHPFPLYGGNGVLGYCSEYLTSEPTVVIGRVGKKCGCVYVAPSKSWISDNALYAKKFVIDIDLHYLAHAVEQLKLNKLKQKSSLPLVTEGIVYEQVILVPPVPEQRAIAHILRTVQRAKDSEDKKLCTLKSLFKVLLDNFMTGNIRV
ncbi:MAG TPA: N-6 DNA methylase [Terriglobales bacterium]|nr:N-6 DNA methylase [Terriglobales bacterium]